MHRQGICITLHSNVIHIPRTPCGIFYMFYFPNFIFLNSHIFKFHYFYVFLFHVSLFLSCSHFYIFIYNYLQSKSIIFTCSFFTHHLVYNQSIHIPLWYLSNILIFISYYFLCVIISYILFLPIIIFYMFLFFTHYYSYNFFHALLFFIYHISFSSFIISNTLIFLIHHYL